MQKDLSYAQAISNRSASRQAAAAAEAAADGGKTAARAAPAGAGPTSAAGGASAAAGDAGGDRGGPADVPKLVFTIDGHHLSSTTTIFQAVQVCWLSLHALTEQQRHLSSCFSCSSAVRERSFSHAIDF